MGRHYMSRLRYVSSVPGAEKPHNLVCSDCRNPGNLMPCETCCRPYHVPCLPPGNVAASTRQFYCPSCRRKQWDQSPPQFPRSTPSSNASRSSIPVVNTPSNYSSPDIDRQQAFACRESSSTAEADILSRARSFLVDYGQFSADQVLRPELLLKLASMMVELESQQALKQEVQIAASEPIINPPSTNTSSILPRPPSGTSGKSWDRIVMILSESIGRHKWLALNLNPY
ncbi:hypothetical protein BDV29DRAFT_190156 [Aspergillus leporis]|uniref:PHD-type domain-containing protein n=1 Tax=Aspergillus leporis TaxID=41062 RepID=A0A5N5X626_9EURO|nr:hypothetical protein BDV29DRAFT_190156 [Aspergillus leporis]